jgi:O-antigen/teichoic acid export membrane protein
MPAAKHNDVTGRRQMASNVLASWASQLIFIAAGFVMPHLIDRSLGQEQLGVWDFSWSLVSYFSLVQSGIIASVSRYVAGYLAVREMDNVNRAVSTAFALLLTAGAIVVAATLAAYFLLGHSHSPKLGAYAGEARVVVLILGLEIAIQTALSTFGGVITGHHKWATHYAMQTIGYAVGVAGMIAALLAGGGLRWMALAHFIGETGAWLARVVLAYRICPTLKVGPRYVDAPIASSMFKWSVKILIPSGGEMLFNQSINLLVMGAMGPSALAIFARSSTLVRQIKSLVAKASGILSPAASALQATEDNQAIQSMALSCGWWTALFSYPFLVLFIIQGGPLVELWMGARYRDDLLIAIISASSCGLIVQYPVLGMLAGLNLHGRSGVAHLVAGIASLGLAWVALQLGTGLLGAAVGFGVPLAVVYMIYIPWYIAHHLKLRFTEYVKSVFVSPALYVMPYAIIQVAARLCWPRQAFLSLLVGGVVGTIVLLFVYWKYAFSPATKEAVCRKLRGFGLLPMVNPVAVAPSALASKTNQTTEIH